MHRTANELSFRLSPCQQFEVREIKEMANWTNTRKINQRTVSRTEPQCVVFKLNDLIVLVGFSKGFTVFVKTEQHSGLKIEFWRTMQLSAFVNAAVLHIIIYKQMYRKHLPVLEGYGDSTFGYLVFENKMQSSIIFKY